MTTCDTVQVRGRPRCAEIDYHTRTRKTHDLKPVGFPVPVTSLLTWGMANMSLGANVEVWVQHTL